MRSLAARSLLFAAVVTGAVMAAASPAQAGTLTRVDAGSGAFAWRYVDVAQLDNELSFENIGGSVRITDVALVTAPAGVLPPGCTQFTAGRSLTCTDNVVRIDVLLGPGNDFVHFDHAVAGEGDAIATRRAYSERPQRLPRGHRPRRCDRRRQRQRHGVRRSRRRRDLRRGRRRHPRRPLVRDGSGRNGLPEQARPQHRRRRRRDRRRSRH